MVLKSYFNNIIVRSILKTKAIVIKGKSKIRLKKNVKIHSYNNARILFGFGDGGLPYNKSSGINLELLDNSQLIIHGDCAFGFHSSLRLENNATLEIGKHTYISSNALIRVAKKVKIGNNCSISWNVTIMDSDFHEYIIDEKLVTNTKEIFIGDNVWIGNNVIILKGVTIGNNSIIAAGSGCKDILSQKLLINDYQIANKINDIMVNYQDYINEFTKIKKIYQEKFLLSRIVSQYINYYKEVSQN